MNPNLAQSLDPKLKETYDRIMGTQLPKAPASPTPQANTPGQTVPNTQPQPEPQPQTPTPTPAPAPTEELKAGMVNINASIPQEKPAAIPKKKISPVIFVVIGVGFFLIYTVVWLKVFKVF